MTRLAGGRGPRSLVTAAVLAASACGAPGAPGGEEGGEGTFPPDRGSRLAAPRAMVSSASPRASEAGVEILRAGGNAVDAAVATAFAVGVVEPQMSGLGGGGGMLVWLRDEGRAAYVDFYAANHAPSWAATARRGTGGSEGEASAAETAGLDIMEAGVPGEVAGLLEAHGRFGRLSRQEVLAPAIRLAEEGFAVNQVLARMIASDSAELWQDPEARAYLWPDGRPVEPGETLRNPALAGVLRRIAREGRDGFYAGPVAEAVVAELNAGGNPTTLDDLASYPVRWKRPVCGVYRGRIVLSAPPPQSGSEIVHVLEMLEPHDLPALGLPTRSPEAFHRLTSALRVGIADNRTNSDPSWVEVPAAGTTSEAFARARDDPLDAPTVPDSVVPGDAAPYDTLPPPPACARHEPYGPAPRVASRTVAGGPRHRAVRGARGPHHPLARGKAGEAARGAGARAAGERAGETTHISVVDAAGNAVSLTRTNSTLFGSGAFVSGFFLNDSGYEFSGDDVDAPSLSPWRVRTSTISPTVVLRGDRVEMVVGAPGGGRIPPAVVQAVVYVLDYGMDPLAAVRMPRIFPDPDDRSVQLEHGYPAGLLAAVRERGWKPAALSFGYARLYLVARRGDRWVGAADPRHDGQVRGY